MTIPPGPPPLPAWAPAGSTWDQLIAVMRFWLKPGDEMFTDEQLQFLMLAADSFPKAVIAGTRAKMRIYNDPNRLKSAQIGNESMTWGEPLSMERERELLNALKADLGLRNGSRVIKLDEYPAVYGVTPYQVSPPPEVQSSTWPYGSVGLEVGGGFDLSRSTTTSQPAAPPARSAARLPPTPPEPPTPRPVRTRPNPPPAARERQGEPDAPTTPAPPPRRPVRTRATEPK